MAQEVDCDSTETCLDTAGLKLGHHSAEEAVLFIASTITSHIKPPHMQALSIQ